jgi:hypothetical protein
MSIQITTTIDVDPEAELVAKTLYAYNSYPGRTAHEIPWPPKARQTLMHYLKLGQAVIEAQRRVALSNGERNDA